MQMQVSFIELLFLIQLEDDHKKYHIISCYNINTFMNGSHNANQYTKNLINIYITNYLYIPHSITISGVTP